ncbi:PREDICTED: uncharacterized protein LOC109223209 [Nicotiana attenuata]|uniref:uncharacterized protein LOC109223209 n=1 Tax=Nicotiana attenuata TaxID=49451 RepID=UPI0009049D33|nr:PREDICTED: uncharacterized protein LOC109223209 [Nicotiana attenuata]
MFGLVNNGAKKHLFPICYIRFQLLFSTAAATSRANVVVDFLVNSLEFSTEEAISTSSKVRPLHSGNTSVLNSLSNCCYQSISQQRQRYNNNNPVKSQVRSGDDRVYAHQRQR